LRRWIWPAMRFCAVLWIYARRRRKISTIATDSQTRRTPTQPTLHNSRHVNITYSVCAVTFSPRCGSVLGVLARSAC